MKPALSFGTAPSETRQATRSTTNYASILKQNPEIFDTIDARVRMELGITTDAEPKTEPVSV